MRLNLLFASLTMVVGLAIPAAPIATAAVPQVHVVIGGDQRRNEHRDRDNERRSRRESKRAEKNWRRGEHRRAQEDKRRGHDGRR